ncbi:MAG TPA: ComF family protein [Leptolyngbyaceae cyanobacterium M65_K2018_010]|nr:ComF family protein [Leptolyngbyaceae cyanobacterium M65_K2018_010]
MESLGIGELLWQQGKRQILGLLLAHPCTLCQRSTPAWLCPDCQQQVYQCQLSDPLDRSHAGLPVISWGGYGGSLKQLIGAFKYGGQPGVAQWLGTELGQLWLKHQKLVGKKATRAIALVPIPLHPTRRRQRGFNQAELLARWVARVGQVPLVEQGLLRVQETQPQHRLNRQDRQTNVAQAFQVHPDYGHQLQQTTVWLVDDIFTTGATAQAAAQTLRRSGVSVAGICTVARALPWSADPA